MKAALMSVGLHVQPLCFDLILTEPEISSQVWVQVTSTNVHENPSKWSRALRYVQMDRQGEANDRILHLFCEHTQEKGKYIPHMRIGRANDHVLNSRLLTNGLI